MDNRQNSSDAALLQAIASRDGAAFATFYRRGRQGLWPTTDGRHWHAL